MSPLLKWPINLNKIDLNRNTMWTYSCNHQAIKIVVTCFSLPFFPCVRYFAAHHRLGAWNRLDGMLVHRRVTHCYSPDPFIHVVGKRYY